MEQAGITDVQLVAACSSLLKGRRYLSGGTGPGRAFASLGVVLLFISNALPWKKSVS